MLQYSKFRANSHFYPFSLDINRVHSVIINSIDEVYKNVREQCVSLYRVPSIVFYNACFVSDIKHSQVAREQRT